MYFTTFLAAIGGISFGFGVLYVFIGIRRATDRRLSLLFGFLALAYAGWIFATRAGYLETDLAGLVAAGRASSALAASSWLLLVLYVAAYSDVRPRLLIYPIVACFAAIAVASLAVPVERLANSAEMAIVTLPWGETVRVVQASDSTLLTVWLLIEVAVAVYITSAIVLMNRREGSRSTVVFAIGAVWFLATIAADFLTSIGVSEFVWLSSVGFAGFVISMGLDSADRAIDTEEKLRLLQAGFETQIAERTAHLEAVNGELVVKTAEEAALAERDRLARELHDAVTQTLFSLNLVAGTLGRLWRTDPEAAERSTDEVQRLARGALADMRVLLRELRPDAIVGTDLGTLISQLSEGLGARHDIRADVDTTGRASLPDDVHFVFYRVAQEAMQNVGKHADASRLVVELTGDNGEVHLAVRDDGVGFDTVDEIEGSMGLRIMQERADTIGAGLSVTSSQGAGTSVALTWSPPEGSLAE